MPASAANGPSVDPLPSATRATTAEVQRDVAPATRGPTAGKAAIMARGESISLARRAAASAKRRREEARLEIERRNTGNPDADTAAFASIIDSSAATRANVSQNKAKRNKRVKWSTEEVDALRDGVSKHGQGRWAVILRDYAHAFHPARISVDLKDKWRNLSKVHRASNSNHRVSSFLDIEHGRGTSKQSVQNLLGHSNRSRVDAARQAAVAAVQLEPIAEAPGEQETQLESPTLRAEQQSNSLQQLAGIASPQVRSDEVCFTRPRVPSHRLTVASNSSGDLVRSAVNEGKRVSNTCHSEPKDRSLSHLPNVHHSGQTSTELRNLEVKPENGVSNTSSDQFPYSSGGSRRKNNGVLDRCEEQVTCGSSKVQRQQGFVHSSGEPLHGVHPSGAPREQFVSKEHRNTRLDRTQLVDDVRLSQQSDEDVEYHSSVLYSEAPRRINVEIRHSREQVNPSADYARHDSDMVVKDSEPYTGNLYVEHVEQEHVEGIEHVEAIDHEDVEHVDDSEHVDDNDHSVVEHVDVVEHIDGVEHVDDIEHVEDVDHLDSIEHVEHIEGEDHAEQIVHVEHLGDVENVTQLEPEMHDGRGDELDDGSRYNSGANGPSESYQHDVQDMQVNMKDCEYESGHVPHRPTGLGSREFSRIYRRSNRILGTARVVDKSEMLQTSFENLPSHRVEDAGSKQFKPAGDDGYSRYRGTKLNESGNRESGLDEDEGNHVYHSLPSVVHVQCSEGLAFVGAELEEHHAENERNVDETRMESPVGDFSHQTDDCEDGGELHHNVREPVLMDHSDRNFEAEQQTITVDDSVGKRRYLQSDEVSGRRNVDDFPGSERLSSSCNFYDDRGEAGEGHDGGLLQQNVDYEDHALNTMDGERTPEEGGSENYGMLHSPTLEGAHVLARLEHAGAGNIGRHDNENDMYDGPNQADASQANHFSDSHVTEHYDHGFRSVSDGDSLSNVRRGKENGLLRSREARYNENDHLYNTDVMMSDKRVVVDIMAAENKRGADEHCLRHDDVQCDDELVQVREDDYDRCYADNTDIKTQGDDDSGDVVGDGVHGFEEKPEENDSKYDRGHEGEWIMRASEEDDTNKDECINSMSESNGRPDCVDGDEDLRQVRFYYSSGDGDDLCLNRKSMDEAPKSSEMHGRQLDEMQADGKEDVRIRKTSEEDEDEG